MTAADLLGRLLDAGARLSLCAGRVRFHGPAALLNDDLRAEIRELADDLRDFLPRRRFTLDELDALRVVGTPCPDGSGLYEVLTHDDENENPL